MMHHRTKDGKLCCVRVTSDHLGPSGVYRFDDFDLAAEFDTVNDGTYAVNTQVAHEVADWCRENGDNPLLRIALCGYADEHALTGWRCHRWKQRKGYQKTEADGTHSGHDETIWFSPACLVPQPTLFET